MTIDRVIITDPLLISLRDTYSWSKDIVDASVNQNIKETARRLMENIDELIDVMIAEMERE